MPDAMVPSGDPSGRRSARERAQKLSDAEKLAHALRILLVRADFGSASIDELIKVLTREERRQLQIAEGRIEARNRFKGLSSHPLHEGRQINHLCIDEGGKSNPERTASATLFALGVVAIDEPEVAAYCLEADKLKVEFFGTRDVTLHEPAMRMRSGHFWFGGNTDRQSEFDEAIAGLIRGTRFVALGIGVRKHAFEEEFVKTGIDPYLPTDLYSVAIAMLLERYLDHLAQGKTAAGSGG